MKLKYTLEIFQITSRKITQYRQNRYLIHSLLLGGIFTQYSVVGTLVGNIMLSLLSL